MVAAGFDVAAGVTGIIAFSLQTLKVVYKNTTKVFVKIYKDAEPHEKLSKDAKHHRSNLFNQRGGNSEDVHLMDKCIRSFEHSRQKLKEGLKSVHESSVRTSKSIIKKTHIDSLYKSTKKKAAELAHAIALTKNDGTKSDNSNQTIDILEHTTSTLQPWNLRKNNAQLTSVGREKENEFNKNLARGRKVAAGGKTYTIREMSTDFNEETGNITQYSISGKVQPTSTPGRTRIKASFKVETIS